MRTLLLVLLPLVSLPAFSADPQTASNGDAWPDAIEYFHRALDHYFITASRDETAGLDANPASGWERTGNTFKTGGSAPVCRFYGSVSPGPNSHFYTLNPAECNALKALQASTPVTQKRWNFESIGFYSTPPLVDHCPLGTQPVFRAYNNGAVRGIDSNHRLSSSAAAMQEVLARGWVDEGLVMCAPPTLAWPIARDAFTTAQEQILPIALPASTPSITREDVALYETFGYSAWQTGPGLPYVKRTELAPGYTGAANAARLLSFFTMTDIHISDKESPAQTFYYGRSAQYDPLASGYSSAYSPIVLSTTHVLDAAVQTVNALHRKTPFDFGIALGDATNNNQYNELRWYIDVLDGKIITPSSGAHLGAETIDYQKPYKAAGLDKAIPWYQVIGNHDQFWMGSAYENGKTQAAHIGSVILNMGNSTGKMNALNESGFYQGVIDGSTPYGDIVGAGPQAWFSSPPPVVADPDRRALATDASSRLNWMREFFTSTSKPLGHGFTQANLDHDFASYSFQPKSSLPLKIIVLDDTCSGKAEANYATGCLDQPRIDWLKSELDEGQRNDKLMIIAAHVPILPQTSLTNPAITSLSLLDDKALLAGLHNYPNLILWISGHRHLNVVTAQPAPDPLNHPEQSFWEVETASLRDFPQQFRTFDLRRNSDNTISIIVTNVDPAVAQGSPAETSRGYAIGAARIFGAPDNQIPPIRADNTSHAYNAELVKQLSPTMQAKIALLGTAIPPLSANNLNLIFVVSPDLAYHAPGDIDPDTANLTPQGLQRSLRMAPFLQQQVLGMNNVSSIYALTPMTHLQTAHNTPDMAALVNIQQFALLNQITLSSGLASTTGYSYPINLSYGAGAAPDGVVAPTPLLPCLNCQGLDFNNTGGNNDALLTGIIDKNSSGFHVFSAPWETLSALLAHLNQRQGYNLTLPTGYTGPNRIYAISIAPAGSASLLTYDSNVNPPPTYPVLPSPPVTAACAAPPFSLTATGAPAGTNTNQTLTIVRHAEAHPTSIFADGNYVAAGQWRALDLPNALRGKISPTQVYSTDPAQVTPGTTSATGYSSWSNPAPALTVAPYAIANNLPYHLVSSFLIADPNSPQMTSDYFFKGGKFTNQSTLLGWQYVQIPQTINALLAGYQSTSQRAPDWSATDYDSVWTVKFDAQGNVTVHNALCEGIDSAQLPVSAPQF